MEDFLIKKINDMNHIFYQIFTTMDTSIPLAPQFDFFFSEYDDFIKSLNIQRTHIIQEISALEKHHKNLYEKRNNIQSEFNSKFSEFKRNVSDMFGRDISDIIIMSADYIKYYKSKTNGRFTESDYNRIQEIFNEKKEDRIMINTLALSLSNTNSDITNTYNRLQNIKQDVIKINKSIQLFEQFKIYYERLIANAKDVVIITNDNSRLYQVTVISTDQLYTKKISYSDPFEHFYPVTIADFPKVEIDLACQSDHLHSLPRRNEDECALVLSNILDVFDEDDDYFYGICSGVRVFTRKDNCIQIDEPAKCTIPYIVMNKHFVRKLLLNDLPSSIDHFTEKYRLILFEHRTYHILEQSSFQLHHGHISDEFFTIVPSCCFDRGGNKSYGDNDLNLLTLLIQNPFNDMLDRLKTFFWNQMVLLFTSNNSFYRSCALQNFKYLFTHSPEEEIDLYNNINEYLRESPELNFRLNFKLIDLFLPEIKLLLHRILYDKLYDKFKIPDKLQMEWEKYVAEHKKPVDTKPQKFLHYLLSVVLSNLVPKDLFSSLRSTLSVMLQSVSIDMATIDGQMKYTFISDIIDRVLKKFILKQEGGIRKHKKNISKRKTGRKLLNNKITSRGNKISRKQK